MTKTLYDPEVEKRALEKAFEKRVFGSEFEKRVFEKAFKEGFEKGFKEGREKVRGQVIEKLLLSGMEAEKIAKILYVDICLVREISERLNI